MCNCENHNPKPVKFHLNIVSDPSVINKNQKLIPIDSCSHSSPLTRPLTRPKIECRMGSHVSLEKTLYETISQVDIPCCQFYLGDKLAYATRTISSDDRNKTFEFCNQNDKTFYVHSPVIANLANNERMDIPRKSLETISAELSLIRDLPAACVLHIGKRGTIENTAQRLNNLKIPRGNHENMPQQLLLESAAGQGTELGWTWDQLRHLFESLDGGSVGLCMDTQHAFAAGMCDFSSHAKVCQFFDNVESICKNRSTNEGTLLRMIHLNDSAKPLSSRVDRHATLRQGHIWSSLPNSEDDGLQSLLFQASDRRIDCISETPDPGFDLILVDSIFQDFPS